MKNIIKRNIPFIIILLGAVVCFAGHDSCLPHPIVSLPDSKIPFSTDQNVLEQTWQPDAKKISAVSVPCEALDDFSSGLRLKIFTDDYGQTVADTAVNCSFAAGESGKVLFQFGTVGVTPGERYRIQLSFEDPSAVGTLLIASGSDYMGCSVDGLPCDQAAAFDITIVKNSRIFWLLAVWFPILSISLMFMVLWRRKWEETAGLSLILSVFVMYVAGLAEHLRVGITLLYVLSAICFGIAVYLYNRRKMTVIDLWSPGLAVYGALFLLILVNCSSLWLGRWDEYSHWGLAVKDMFYYDSFAKHYNTTVMLPRYLPFSTLFEYFYVSCNGLFTPTLLYAAYQTVLLSMMIVVCKASHGRWRYILAPTAVVALTPLMFFFDAYNSIYVDSMLAVFTAYILSCYFMEGMSVFNMLRIVAGLFALTMTKDAGFVIAGLLAFVMLADVLCRRFSDRREKLKNLAFAGICLALVVGFFASWQLYLRIPVKAPVAMNETGAPASSDVAVPAVSYGSAVSASGLSLEGIRELLRGDAPWYKYASIKKFVDVVFSNGSFVWANIGISYIDLFILILVVIGILYYTGYWGDSAGRMVSFGVFTFIGGIGYCAFLELMYLFAFSEYEAVHWSSHNRYLGSYIGGVFIALLCCILCRAKSGGQTERGQRLFAPGRGIPLLVLAFVMVAAPVEGFIIRNSDSEVTEDMVYGVGQTEEILRSFSRRGDKIFYVCNNTSGYSYYIFKVTACPLQVTQSYFNFLGSRESVTAQTFIYEANNIEVKGVPRVVDRETWQDDLQDYDYVFIEHPDELFAADYGVLFEDPETVGNGTFYEVVKQNGDLALHYVGRVGIKEWK